MICLSLLKYLEDRGFGTIDKNLFWGKMGLDDIGVYISEIGEPGARGARRAIQYELYSRGTDDVSGYLQLSSIVEHLNSAYSSICTLPRVQKPNGDILSRGFSNVTIMPLSTITNAGQDANGRVIYTATGRVYY